MKKWVFVFGLVLSFNANATTSGNCGPKDENGEYTSSCTWTYENNTLTISGSGNGEMADFGKEANPYYNPDVPSYESHQCTYITDAPWGIYSNEITNVKVTTGVKELGERAFMGLALITDVSLPDGLLTIGDSVFNNALSLKNVNVPDSVTSIGGHAFRGTLALENIEIPNSVISIGEYAFYNAFDIDGKMKNIVLGDSVEEIDYGAFKGLNDTVTIYCQDGNNKHGGKTCAEVIAKNTKFEGTIQPYTKINNTLYSTTINGVVKYYSSLNKLAKNIELKRIYTIEEANRVAGAKNRVSIRYR